jgi:hypothetical protein
MTLLLILAAVGLLVYAVFAAYRYGYAAGMKAEREAQQRRGRLRSIG